MNILVSGSLAYDRIMDFPGYFAEHILPEKIHILNVCFQVNGLKEKFGGTAGNIAYALCLMGEKPIISAAIGNDYRHYFESTDAIGLSTAYIRIVPGRIYRGGLYYHRPGRQPDHRVQPGGHEILFCAGFRILRILGRP